MLIVAVSEAAAIGKEIVGAVRLHPTSEIIERHYSHGRHNGTYKCHDSENRNIGFPLALFLHSTIRQNFALFLQGKLLPQSRRLHLRGEVVGARGTAASLHDQNRKYRNSVGRWVIMNDTAIPKTMPAAMAHRGDGTNRIGCRNAAMIIRG